MRRRIRGYRRALGSAAHVQQPGTQQGNDQQRHDVDDLDQGIDRRAGSVLVRVANGVSSHSGLVGLGTFTAKIALLDILFGIVPGATASTHRDGDKETGHDRAHQQSAQCLGAE